MKQPVGTPSRFALFSQSNIFIEYIAFQFYHCTTKSRNTCRSMETFRASVWYEGIAINGRKSFESFISPHLRPLHFDARFSNVVTAFINAISTNVLFGVFVIDRFSSGLSRYRYIKDIDSPYVDNSNCLDSIERIMLSGAISNPRN